jgi:hypothetical protein
MHAIIIGDIVGSRRLEARIWLPVLEEVLQKYSKNFDIFRGDSFQADIPLFRCFEFIFYLKARLKALGKLDIRMGIGIGHVDYVSKAIKSSNGQAFVLAGEALEALKKELISLRSPWTEYDEPINIMLDMAIELANKWTVNMAESVAAALAHPAVSQKELANILDRKYQSQVSTELNKGYYSRIKQVIDYSTKELVKRC